MGAALQQLNCQNHKGHIIWGGVDNRAKSRSSCLPTSERKKQQTEGRAIKKYMRIQNRKLSLGYKVKFLNHVYKNINGHLYTMLYSIPFLGVTERGENIEFFDIE